MGGINVKKSNQSKAEPNVVPLCDILLVLLIIFMVITPLVKGGVPVTLPEAANTQIQPNPDSVITVSINKDGHLYVDLVEVPNLASMTAMLEDKIQNQKHVEKIKLLLKANEELPYGKVTEIMDEIRKSQFEVVGLLAQGKITTE